MPRPRTDPTDYGTKSPGAATRQNVCVHPSKALNRNLPELSAVEPGSWINLISWQFRRMRLAHRRFRFARNHVVYATPSGGKPAPSSGACPARTDLRRIHQFGVQSLPGSPGADPDRGPFNAHSALRDHRQIAAVRVRAYRDSSRRRDEPDYRNVLRAQIEPPDQTGRRPKARHPA
jgi:hypothetical protein